MSKTPAIKFGMTISNFGLAIILKTRYKIDYKNSLTFQIAFFKIWVHFNRK